MNEFLPLGAERALVLAPRGRDAVVARDILREARIQTQVCADLGELMKEIGRGADVAIVTEEGLRDVDNRALGDWVGAQPPWSDFPFIVLTRHGGGVERNPEAAQLNAILGNVSFLERPFHPTTLVSVVQTSLRGRRRQYECRRLNENLESLVEERTAELAAANRQLLAQIEERERMEMTMRQMQRLEAVGQLTSGVAHDFNNLLTVVLGNIRFLDRALNDAKIDGNATRRLGYMRAAAERGAKLTDQLLAFSRRQRLEPKVIDLNGTISGMRDLLQSTIGGSFEIDLDLAPGLWPALVDPTQLELAVLNLAINGRDAMQIGGALRVSTRNMSLGPASRPEEPSAGDYVEICVADTGTGMSDDVRAKVFEPFFTTKEVGKGSGLGLSQVLGFAKQSGGGMRIVSKEGEGTAVCIFLPRAEARTNDPTAEAAAPQAPTHPGARVLLVDDDNAVRDVTAAMLRDIGYAVLEAGSGGAALELLDRRQDIDVVLIDIAMPGMSGAELARRVRIIRPGLPILFVTGFAERGMLDGVGDAQIVGKPFLTSELADKVRLALAAGASRAGVEEPAN
ncbi:MAG TPA: response regulator [Pseudolabrys sp.]|nr:response regulator [Pseudolabrys sp.]